MHLEQDTNLIRRLFAVLRQRSRQKRYIQIQRLGRLDSLSGFILDLGGGPASFFASLFPNPAQIILLELDQHEARVAKKLQPAFRVVVADGQALPFADGSIELTVSNSVIEHVNDPSSLARDQAVSHAISHRRQWQFSLEPHSLFRYHCIIDSFCRCGNYFRDVRRKFEHVNSVRMCLRRD
jgi:hypothetical protein